MVNNSNNINNTNNHLLLSLTEHNKEHDKHALHCIGYPHPVMVQAQRFGGVQRVNGMPHFSYDNPISGGNTYINKR